MCDFLTNCFRSSPFTETQILRELLRRSWDWEPEMEKLRGETGRRSWKEKLREKVRGRDLGGLNLAQVPPHREPASTYTKGNTRSD